MKYSDSIQNALDILNAMRQPILKEGQKRIELEYFQVDFDNTTFTETLKSGGLVNHKSFDIEIPFEKFEKWMCTNYREKVHTYRFMDVNEIENDYKHVISVSWSDLMNELEASIAKEFLQTIL